MQMSAMLCHQLDSNLNPVVLRDYLVPDREMGVIASVLAPWTIGAAGARPGGLWQVYVELESKFMLAVAFQIRLADRTPPKLIDVFK